MLVGLTPFFQIKSSSSRLSFYPADHLRLTANAHAVPESFKPPFYLLPLLIHFVATHPHTQQSAADSPIIVSIIRTRTKAKGPNPTELL